MIETNAEDREEEAEADDAKAEKLLSGIIRLTYDVRCIPPRYVLERVHSTNYLNLVAMATLLALVAIVL